MHTFASRTKKKPKNPPPPPPTTSTMVTPPTNTAPVQPPPVNAPIPLGNSTKIGGHVGENTSKNVIGSSKRSGLFSRREAEGTMSHGVDAAGKALIDAFDAKLSPLKTFNKVAFLIAGQDGAALGTAFETASGGRVLRSEINTRFGSTPGPKAASYLYDCLGNNGMPSLIARLWLTTGLVDDSGYVAAAAVKIPGLGGKIGSKGDTKRLRELLERAEPAERKKAWADPLIRSKITAIDPKLAERINQLVHVDDAKAVLDKAVVGGGPTTTEEYVLARERDLQLAISINQLVTKVPVIGKAAVFNTKKFYDELIAWKTTASPEDIKEIQKPNSRFKAAMAKLPTNILTGLSTGERTMIDQLIGGSGTGSGTDTQIEGVKQSLARQKDVVGRGKDGGGGNWMASKIRGKVTGRKWRDLATEIKLLSSDQRKKVLDDYDIDPAVALGKLDADLLQAGFDKEGRAGLKALFNTSFGNIGDNYAELWEIMSPGKGTKIGETLSHLKPTKLGKIGQAKSGKTLGKKALKIILHLEDNEWALVRQDTTLLALMQQGSDDKTFAAILAVLGMKDPTDQLTGTSARENVHQAKLAGEANPYRITMLLDDIIEENTVGKGVSAGREKARLFTVASEAQAAAHMLVKEDPNYDPLHFLQQCLDGLEQSNPKKVKYLKERVPLVYAAFTKNAPIPVEARVQQAKHEGFGVGDRRNVDRQKLYWAFNDLRGRQLLDEWSNVHEFTGLSVGSKHAEKKILEATNVLDWAKPNPSPEDEKQQRQATADLSTYCDTLAHIHGQMQTFVIGIKQERRADLKSLGLGAEDRIKFEAMVSDKLADAMDEDHEVQAILDDAKLPYDDFMKAKMKGVDALEMQRYLDTTRQWNKFSTKSSQLGEATRNVKGSALSTERKLESGTNTGKSETEIKDIRDEGGEQTEQAVRDRTSIEARFRDMQDAFKKRAMFIFKLMVTAIVTAIVAGVTFGAGTPLSIGLHFALEAGFAALEAFYRYHVLGETDLKQLAIGFGMNLLGATVKVLSMNMTVALNASILNPTDWGAGLDWIAAPLAKGMGTLANQAVMFVPTYMKEKAMQEKMLEKVIKEGEDNIGDEAVSQLGKSATGFFKKIAIAGVKELKGVGLEGISGEPTVPKPMPKQKQFGQAYTDRLMGGTGKEEQDQMWGRYEKGKKKEAKKDGKKVVKELLIPEEKRTKSDDESLRKGQLKDDRSESKSPGWKAVKQRVEANLSKLRTARGEQLLSALALAGICTADLLTLTDDEQGKIEDVLHMTPGQLPRELKLPSAVLLVMNTLSPFRGALTSSEIIVSTLESNQIDPSVVIRWPSSQVDQLAAAVGLSPAVFRKGLLSAAYAKHSTSRSRPPRRPPPPPPETKPTTTTRTKLKVPNRPPPPVPTSVKT